MNFLFSCSVIIVSAILLMVIDSVIKSGGYRVAFTFWIVLIGFIFFVGSFFASEELKDNWFIIAFSILSFIELIFIIVVYSLIKPK